MGDDEDTEPKYKFFVPGSDEPRPDGSKSYTGHGRALYPQPEGQAKGDTYEGTYVEGYRRGKGIYTFGKNGDAYDGYYEENKKHGFGKMTYSNNMGEDEEDAGDEPKPLRGGGYLGFFTAGRRGCRERDNPGDSQSEGTFTYANGDIYVGQWRAGKKHGRGTYSYAKDGTKMVGEWDTGKITNGQWIFPNGVQYTGPFRYNKPFGKGVWVFKNGNQLIGEYAQKEQQADDEPPADDDDAAAVKPDPKVWCSFRHGKDVAVRGGTMFPQTL